MQYGVSYFGVRNPRHFQRDLDDIARLGFTYIVFTFPPAFQQPQRPYPTPGLPAYLLAALAGRNARPAGLHHRPRVRAAP